MKAFYTDSRDISSPVVLEAIGRETGLEVETFTVGMRNPRFEAEVYEETRHAQEHYGIRSIPVVVVDNRFLVEGAVPLARYQQVISEVRSAGSAEHHKLNNQLSGGIP
jgi:predicted DsbA family dithiol-disulfide isomerase